MKYTFSAALAFVVSIPATAFSDGLVTVTAHALDPTLAQCISAIEEGVHVGNAPDGAQIFWFGSTAYFVTLTKQSFGCEAVRYY